jgi:hypothetical protein
MKVQVIIAIDVIFMSYLVWNDDILRDAECILLDEMPVDGVKRRILLYVPLSQLSAIHPHMR